MRVGKISWHGLETPDSLTQYGDGRFGDENEFLADNGLDTIFEVDEDGEETEERTNMILQMEDDPDAADEIEFERRMRKMYRRNESPEVDDFEEPTDAQIDAAIIEHMKGSQSHVA